MATTALLERQPGNLEALWSRANSRRRLADDALRRGDNAAIKLFEGAINDFAGVIKLNQTQAKAYINHADALRELADIYARNKVDNTKLFEMMRASAEQATRISPRAWQAWALYGVALGNLKRTDEAVEAIRHALTIQPDNADLQSVLRQLQGR